MRYLVHIWLRTRKRPGGVCLDIDIVIIHIHIIGSPEHDYKLLKNLSLTKTNTQHMHNNYFPWGARPDFSNVVRIKMTDSKLVSTLQKRWAEDSAQMIKLLNICEKLIAELDARGLEGWAHIVDCHCTCSQQLRKAINALRNMEATINNVAV